MDQLGLLISVGIAAAAGERRPWRSDLRQPCQSERGALVVHRLFWGTHRGNHFPKSLMLNGGRTRDRTLDLSRVKATFSH
jgi:hypothetical protein